MWPSLTPRLISSLKCSSIFISFLIFSYPFHPGESKISQALCQDACQYLLVIVSQGTKELIRYFPGNFGRRLSSWISSSPKRSFYHGGSCDCQVEFTVRISFQRSFTSSSLTSQKQLVEGQPHHRPTVEASHKEHDLHQLCRAQHPCGWTILRSSADVLGISQYR